MIGGYETLSEIDDRIAMQRAEAARLESREDALNKRLDSLRQETMRLIDRFTALHFEAIEKDEAQSGLLEVERLMRKREAAYDTLQAKIEALDAQLRDLEEQRRTLTQEKLSIEKTAIKQREVLVQKLQADKSYRNKLEEAKRLGEIAKVAKAKADTAKESYEQKKRPFDADALFSYLWRRRYGTSRYKGGWLTRWLDGKVANLIDYEKYRLAYATIEKMIPGFELHAKKALRKAAEAKRALQAHEAKLAEEIGLDATLAKLQTLSQRLAAIDKEIEAKERQNDALLAQKAQYLKDEDEAAQESKALLKQCLAQEDIAVLMRKARQSSDTEDDEIAYRLQSLEAESSQLETELAQVRAQYESIVASLRELERLRSSYKRARYDRYGSGFDSAVVGDILGDVIGGMLNSGVAWERMREVHREIPNTDWGGFGSGSIDLDFGGDLFDDIDIGGGGFFEGGGIESDSFSTGGGF